LSYRFYIAANGVDDPITGENIVQDPSYLNVEYSQNTMTRSRSGGLIESISKTVIGTQD
jgi:hypothetical protein